MLTTDLTRFFEIEDFLDPYLKSKRINKEIPKEKMLDFVRRMI